MRIKYENIPFKTNRNMFLKKPGGKYNLDLGMNVSGNLNQIQKKVKVVDISLTKVVPRIVYHTSTSPITSLKDRIFYVSFDKFQSFAHGLATVAQDISPFNDEKKLYFYELEPIKPTMKVVMFDEKTRPKTVSNNLGITYNAISEAGQISAGFGLPINKTNVLKQNFREGSGDNMLLGHLICSKSGVNGVRNTIDQDELAICNPKDNFKIVKKVAFRLSDLARYRNSILEIIFSKSKKSYKYKFKSTSLQGTENKLMNAIFKSREQRGNNKQFKERTKKENKKKENKKKINNLKEAKKKEAHKKGLLNVMQSFFGVKAKA